MRFFGGVAQLVEQRTFDSSSRLEQIAENNVFHAAKRTFRTSAKTLKNLTKNGACGCHDTSDFFAGLAVSSAVARFVSSSLARLNASLRSVGWALWSWPMVTRRSKTPNMPWASPPGCLPLPVPPPDLNPVPAR